ncbi:MAG: LysM peptidoglycan-binding domain-containing protein [Alphaproteobacteria bacterium]|nr:LysM peptidoglycan-binding domain-containing protein [Alphaproteobacteria bacterium]
MTRALVLGGCAAAGLGVLVWLAVQMQEPADQAATDTAVAPSQQEAAPGEQAPAQTEPQTASKPEAEESQPAAAGGVRVQIEPPSFDVVRINPEGEAVIAGRAEPGAKVTIVDDGKDMGSVTADERGEFVFLPEKPMAPGNRELTLKAETEQGGAATSEDVVVLQIPERKEGEPAEAPVAILLKNEAKPQLAEASPEPELQSQQQAADEGAVTTGQLGPDSADQPVPPATVPPAEGAPQIARIMQSPNQPEGGTSETDAAQVTIEVIHYDERGTMRTGGTAPPRSNVLVYLDNNLIGRTTADEEGRWLTQSRDGITPGTYVVRADAVTSDGEVVARSEVAFERFAPSQVAEAARQPNTYVVEPGNSLWRIARRQYGRGVRYWLIYEANKNQIRDPDLIYPGQVFVLPRS